MARPTFYPTTITDESLTGELAAETRKSFDEITTAMAASSTAKKTTQKPKRSLVTVLVNMPHVKKYGKAPTMQLTYACTYVVAVGDKVLCPPTRLNPKWTTGVVTDLEANGYRGPVKFVKPLGAPVRNASNPVPFDKPTKPGKPRAPREPFAPESEKG